MEGKIICKRYSCYDDFETCSEVELDFQIRKGYNDELWISLQGGPTGYESATWRQSFFDAILEGKDWSACFGTKKRWDRLIVLNSELRRIFSSWKEIKENDQT